MALLAMAAAAHAAEPQQVKLSFSVRDRDGPSVRMSVAVPPGTQHRLQVAEHLTLAVGVKTPEADGTIQTPVRLLSDASGTHVRRRIMLLPVMTANRPGGSSI
jgi:hypothetical protein